VVVIQPQFERVATFKDGFALIGGGCENILLESHSENHEDHDDCHHYTTKCNKLGYIDTTGKIIQFGEFTFEEVKEMIKKEAE